jgi:hypothetical protein
MRSFFRFVFIMFFAAISYNCSGFSQGLPPATTAGQVPVSTGAGTTYAAQTITAPFVGAPSLSATSSQIFDGPIIAPQVQGDFSPLGYPGSGCTIGSTHYSTAGDCAFYSAVVAANSTGLNQRVILPCGTVTTTAAGWIEPANSHNSVVMVEGCGYGDGNGTNPASVLQLTGTPISSAVIVMPHRYSSSGDGPGVFMGKFYIDANNFTVDCLDVLGAGRSTFEHIYCSGSKGPYGFHFGDSSVTNNTGYTYELSLRDLFVDTMVHEPGARATAVAALSSGAVTGITYTATGAYSSTSALQVIFEGTDSSGNRCNAVATVANNSGTPATPVIMNGGTTCDAANSYVEIMPTPSMTSAFFFDWATDIGNADDLRVNGLTSNSDFLCGPKCDGNTFTGLHGYSGEQIMLHLEGHNDTFIATKFDSPSGWGAYIESNADSNSFYGGYRVWDSQPNSNVNNGPIEPGYPGAQDFYEGASQNKFTMMAGCGTQPIGYNTFVIPTGPVGTGSNLFPSGDDVVGVQSCASGNLYPAQISNNLRVNGSTALIGAITSNVAISSQAATVPSLVIGGAGGGASMQIDGVRMQLGYTSGGNVVVQSGTGHPLDFGVSNATFGSGLVSGFGTSGVQWNATGASIAAASTITPTSQISHLSGTIAFSTITPPNGCTTSGQGCTITLICDDACTWDNSGNIKAAPPATAVANIKYVFTWDGSGRWY